MSTVWHVQQIIIRRFSEERQGRKTLLDMQSSEKYQYCIDGSEITRYEAFRRNALFFCFVVHSVDIFQEIDYLHTVQTLRCLGRN